MEISTTTSWWSLPVLVTGGVLSGLVLLLLPVMNKRLQRKRRKAVTLKKPEHKSLVLIDRTPKELAGLLEGKTTVSLENVRSRFIGRPMRVNGKVFDVSQSSNKRWLLCLNIEGLSGLAFLRFPNEWGPQLRSLKVGEEVTVLGELKEFETFEIHLENCGLE